MRMLSDNNRKEIAAIKERYKAIVDGCDRDELRERLAREGLNLVFDYQKGENAHYIVVGPEIKFEVLWHKGKFKVSRRVTVDIDINENDKETLISLKKTPYRFRIISPTRVTVLNYDWSKDQGV